MLELVLHKKETFYFFDVFSTGCHLLHSTVHNFTFPLILAQLCVRLSTLSLFKVSISSASLRFNDHLLILPCRLLSLWSPLHTIFCVCCAFFPILSVLLFLSGTPLPPLSVSDDYPPPLVIAPLKATLHPQGSKWILSPSLLKKESAPKRLLCLQVHLNHFSVSTHARANSRACGTYKYSWTGILLCSVIDSHKNSSSVSGGWN